MDFRFHYFPFQFILKPPHGNNFVQPVPLAIGIMLRHADRMNSCLLGIMMCFNQRKCFQVSYCRINITPIIINKPFQLF